MTLLLVLLLGCTRPAEVPTGRLLYVSEREERPDVRLLDLATGEDRPLDTGPGSAFPGPPDPRGELALAVTSEDHDDFHREQLVAVPLAGGALRPLSPPAVFVRNPVFTPDGAAVVFESSQGSFRDVYRVDRRGGPVTRLTQDPQGNFEPSVAPDGRILVGSSRTGEAEIFRLDPDGSATRLTTSPGDDVRPRWSPDGSRLAFLTAREGRQRAWLAAPDGSGARPVRTEGAEEHEDLVWSPDGRRLALTALVGPDDLDVLVVDAERGALVGRLGGPGVDEQPAWSPDGHWLAWAATRGDTVDVWAAHPDGSAARRLTTDPAADWLPRWLPGTAQDAGGR